MQTPKSHRPALQGASSTLSCASGAGALPVLLALYYESPPLVELNWVGW